MTTFVFWNVNGKELGENICRLADAHQVDVLILAESPFRPEALELLLTEGCAATFRFCYGDCKRIQIYARFAPENIRPVRDDPRFTIREVTLPSRVTLLLVGAHLRSKLHADQRTQLLDCQELADQIRQAEEAAGHTRTLLVGDLNMNPFEDGVAAARALNAVMSRDIALGGQRELHDKRYPFFYNPMWGHLGDVSGTPAGSYFYRSSDDVCYYWNIFDQVLVRPDLLEYFDANAVRILDSDGKSRLVGDGRPPQRPVLSDHLPLLFTIGL